MKWSFSSRPDHRSLDFLGDKVETMAVPQHLKKFSCQFQYGARKVGNCDREWLAVQYRLTQAILTRLQKCVDSLHNADGPCRVAVLIEYFEYFIHFENLL